MGNSIMMYFMQGYIHPGGFFMPLSPPLSVCEFKTASEQILVFFLDSKTNFKTG